MRHGPRGEEDVAIRQLVDRYLREVVEAWGLCPWAAPARRAGELLIHVAWPPDDAEDALTERVRQWVGDQVPIGLLVLPCAQTAPSEHRALRDRIMAAVPGAIVADFHPTGGEVPPRGPAHLVHLLRRSPDRMLQVVPTSHLQALTKTPTLTPGQQLRALAGMLEAQPDVRGRIATDNWDTVCERGVAELVRVLDELADARAKVAVRVGGGGAGATDRGE